MVVLTGSARIRFGVADVHSSGNDDASSPENSTDTVSEEGGVEVEANAGDVFILPAGTAHKTFNTLPEASLKLLTPGNGHAVKD
jgi:mannose-6-phosphate isomerase-like protein (cupin superfamily)